MRITKDNVVNAVCIFGIVVTICVILTIILKTFYAQAIDIAFVKDIFSIGSTLAAALIAIALFNDWKEQHNKTILAPEAIEIYKNINSDIKLCVDYNYAVKTKRGESFQDDLALEILDEFKKCMDAKSNRIIDLKYFSTLAQNEEITSLTFDYSEVFNKYLDFLESTSSKQPYDMIDQKFIDITYDFMRDAVNFQFKINTALSNYILIK
ncbi:hypothetical protein [Acinetobacter sp. NIPH 2100]|uniref:hypothetical protein n=1 Tax=Acinetobacter sp. NIPH 2100 TaxID=1217708 RepID=UPI0002D0A7A0|nr:hypothetical protein [Acinetobacter sp. NIPH 2100]ENX41514.1 hypothetical protein F887_01910 [Acinetobacter sp. NIPH 2100]